MRKTIKYGCFFGLLFAVLLITSCKKDKVDPYIETWKQQNEKAFNDLAFNPDYTKLSMPGGNLDHIYYRVIQKGEGKRVFYNSRAEVYYKGWFVVTNENYGIKAGTLFDQRLFDDGVTYKLAINAQAATTGYSSYIIEGWKIALQYMVEGDKWEVWIPYRYASGLEGIPNYSTLAFEIELVKAIGFDEFALNSSSSSY